MRSLVGHRAAGTVAVVLVAAAIAGCTSRIAGSAALAPDYPAGRDLPQVTSAPPPPTRTAAPSRAPTTPATPPGSIPAAFAGTWSGQANQPNGVIRHWKAVLVLAAGRTAGTFQVAPYCRGAIAVRSASSTRLVGVEVIVSDPRSTCAASGIVTLQRTGPNRATMRWVDNDHPANIATATLTRR